MANALISVVVEQLASFLLDHLKEDVELVPGARGKVKKLYETFQKIDAVLEDAEKQGIKDEYVKRCLQELKDVTYEIEDLLDEWHTRILISQMDGGEDNAGSSDSKKKVSLYFLSLCSCFPKITLHSETSHKIKKMREKLNVIEVEKDKFELHTYKGFEERFKESPRKMTIFDVKIYGRDLEKNFIVRKLLGESSQDNTRVPVIYIVGMGGLGKTTLAQLVFNDDLVCSHFEKKIWVYVSDPFDVEMLAKYIIGALGDSIPAATDWNTLHVQLCESLKDKRILLVLDDIWTEDKEAWEKIRSALDHCLIGSAVLITTRNKFVSVAVGSSYEHDIQLLNDEDCWQLFSSCAFKGRLEKDLPRLEYR